MERLIGAPEDRRRRHAALSPTGPAFTLDSEGHLPITERPGLGIELDWQEAERAAKQGVVWRDEEMFLADGTMTNW